MRREGEGREGHHYTHTDQAHIHLCPPLCCSQCFQRDPAEQIGLHILYPWSVQTADHMHPPVEWNGYCGMEWNCYGMEWGIVEWNCFGLKWKWTCCGMEWNCCGMEWNSNRKEKITSIYQMRLCLTVHLLSV